MLTKRHFAALLLLVCAVVLSTQRGPAEQQAALARSAVDARLSLVDRARADESWRQASAGFKGATTPQRWSATLAHVRRTLGSPGPRVLQRTTETDRLPTGQPGRFLLFEFNTPFQNRPGVTFEAVAATAEPDGQWRVAWYDVK